MPNKLQHIYPHHVVFVLRVQIGHLSGAVHHAILVVIFRGRRNRGRNIVRITGGVGHRQSSYLVRIVKGLGHPVIDDTVMIRNARILPNVIPNHVAQHRRLFLHSYEF